VRPDSTLACWGLNAFGQATPPGGTFTQASAGGDHTCGVKTDGTLACWGNNSVEQATPPDGTFTQVSAGLDHTCGVKTGGTLACWGFNSEGQATPPGGTFTQVSAGRFHSCGVKTDGTLACWGNNFFRQATPPDGTFTQVSGGNDHACGVKIGGALACWGLNFFGQATPPDGTFTQVSAGRNHTCGVKTDGTLACWGSNSDGQATPPGGTFTQVSAGGPYTCGVKTDGTLACWGDNTFGQATPPAEGPELTALSPAHLWIGLKNSGAVGLRVDLQVEVFADETLIGAGVLANVATGSSGFNNARLQVIPLVLTGGPVEVPAGTELALAVSVRRTCSGGGHRSGTVRLWYDGQPVDSGSGRDAGSRFDATIDGEEREFFLRSGFSLSEEAGTSRVSVDAAVDSAAACPDRPYTLLGTWSLSLP
jgi:hypothetical protein